MPYLHYACVYTQRQERSHGIDSTSQQQIQYVSACHQFVLSVTLLIL